MRQVLHQDPLAFLLGLQGIALMRAFSGQFDRAFTERRLAEVRLLLSGELGLGEPVSLPPVTTAAGYGSWAASYDTMQNELLEIEQPVVRAVLDSLPPGAAVDVACGTGRHTSFLEQLGHAALGVDRSAQMLAHARRKLPDTPLLLADLHALPLPHHHADLVVCALALTHVPDLTAAFTELVRVLKPGGSLVISDARGLFAGIRPPVVQQLPDGSAGYLPHRIWPTGAYLRAALSLGLELRSYAEPARPQPPPGTTQAGPPPVSGAPPDLWALCRVFPEAARAAGVDDPACVMWHFQRRAR